MMDDDKLDKMMREATRPSLPQGFEARMAQRLEQTQQAKIIAFPQRHKPRANPWIIGVPLAASLLIGLSLGALGVGENLIAGADQELAGIETGLDEAELAAEEEQT